MGKPSEAGPTFTTNSGPVTWHKTSTPGLWIGADDEGRVWECRTKGE